MFFNERAKNNFIDEYKQRRSVILTSLTGLFNKTALFERELGRDCGDFTCGEILAMYKAFNAKSVNVLENYNVYLKNYAFTLADSDGENNYADITKAMLTDCIDADIQSRKFITREQLDNIENELHNYTDKAILECLWHGIGGKSMEDLVSLTRDMVSDNKKYLCLKDGRTVRLTEKLYELLDKAFDEKKYICYSDDYMVKRMSPDCLYKEMDNAYTPDSSDKFFRWVYRRVRVYRDYVGMPLLTMKNIQASGLLYAIKEGMARKNLGFREFLYTECGRELAIQYGYSPKYYVNVLANKYSGVL